MYTRRERERLLEQEKERERERERERAELKRCTLLKVSSSVESIHVYIHYTYRERVSPKL